MHPPITRVGAEKSPQDDDRLGTWGVSLTQNNSDKGLRAPASVLRAYVLGYLQQRPASLVFHLKHLKRRAPSAHWTEVSGPLSTSVHQGEIPHLGHIPSEPPDVHFGGFRGRTPPFPFLFISFGWFGSD